MSIKVSNLSRYYGKQKAVDNISFEIGRKEIVGFIGPNGAGKSTTMKILCGILPASSGSAYINGLDIRTNPLQIKQHIGYLPENNPVYPEMYVREYLSYVTGLYNKTSRDDRSAGSSMLVNKAIELTGLGPEQHKKIQALSKGYRQRVGLAQAIIHDPEVLILDEPTSGLDPGQIVDIRNMIKELGNEKTVLLSTHLMQEVEAICDRVIMINRGCIVADGSPGSISQSITGKLATILLEFDKPADTSKLGEIEGISRSMVLKENKYLVESESGMDVRPLLFQFAVKEGLTILSLQKKEKNLEEVFQELTK